MSWVSWLLAPWKDALSVWVASTVMRATHTANFVKAQGALRKTVMLFSYIMIVIANGQTACAIGAAIHAIT
jgi:hypothetical protein